MRLWHVPNARRLSLETVSALPPQYPRWQHKNRADQLEHALHGDAQEAERKEQ